MSNSEGNRESIWSITPRWRTAYFAIFSISYLAAVCVIVGYEIANRGDAHPVQVFVSIAEKAAVVGVAIAITLISIVEVARGLMVIADYLREHWLEPSKRKRHEELRAEGRAEANVAWSEWLERRSKAEANGELFDEPRPDQAETDEGKR